MSTESSETSPLSGFILTRQWIESRDGLELIFWLASSLGPVRVHLLNQEAVCFFPTEQAGIVKNTLGQQTNWRSDTTHLKSFQQEAMSALYLGSQRHLFDCRKKLASRSVQLAESDIRPTDRFLMERFITGGASVSGQIVKAQGFIEMENARLQTLEYRPQLEAVSIDIETDYAADTLYSIALYSNKTSTVLMIGSNAAAKPELDRTELSLRFFEDEAALLQAFLEYIRVLDPDVLMGWNVVNFDLRRLQEFADRAGIPLQLGRNGEVILWRKAIQSNDRYYALIPGRVALDGIELMRSATYQFENFSLEYVARQLLHRGKLIDDVDQRGAEITALFEADKPALARYNLEDCRLVWDIFCQENLLGFAIERSLLTGLELDRYGGSVAALDFLYLPRLHRSGYVAPAREHLESANISPGGYVMGSLPGLHDNVILLDFKSLYPSIIRSFHVDPLALVVGLEETDAIEGYDGGMFSRTHFILPDLIERLWAARDEAKAKGNAVLSQAIKIIMNSFYGVLGTQGCRFFDSRLVSSITRRGHEIIIASKKFIEAQGYQVIYGDTDSVFVLLGTIDAASVAEIGTGLANQLNTWWREKLLTEHRVESYLEIEFETHFNRFLMPTVRGSEAGSKKRYAGLIGEDKILFKGLETVRSDWSPLAREFQKVLYKDVFLDRPFEGYIKQVVTNLLDGKYEAELVLRKRLRRKLDDYVKNVPPHVQAARKAEAIRQERGLPSLYESGGWIEYLMTACGPEPRLYRQSPIDYEFYIDKQLTPIADAILVFKSSSMAKILDRQMGLFV
ncbi:MAG: DNA polymerase II [Proteobacteria bacterium]|nr:DNA polymerase II [Pseudomonadota bacterium]